jgi:hypothetical protein
VPDILALVRVRHLRSQQQPPYNVPIFCRRLSILQIGEHPSMTLIRSRLAVHLVVVANFCLLTVIATSTSASAAEPKAAKAKKDSTKAGEKTEVKYASVPDGGLQPQAAVDAAGTLHLIYLGDDPGSCNIYYVRKAAGEEKFSPPLRVNSQDGSAIATGSIRGAHLALGKANRVHVAWNGSGNAEPRGPKKYDSPMLYTRMVEDGNSFEPQRERRQVWTGRRWIGGRRSRWQCLRRLALR